jgi:hypothetical protein
VEFTHRINTFVGFSEPEDDPEVKVFGRRGMDINKMLAELKVEREQLEEAMMILENFARLRGRRRGRPPAWMSQTKRRGRPPGSKNRPKEQTGGTNRRNEPKSSAA